MAFNVVVTHAVRPDQWGVERFRTRTVAHVRSSADERLAAPGLWAQDKGKLF